MSETTAIIQSAIDRCNAGDPGALNDLFTRAAERLKQLARKMLRDDRVRQREQTGDLVQETCFALFKALAEKPVRTPREFFYLSSTIMRRKLIDMARHHYGPEGSAANQANVPLGGSTSAPGFTPVERTNDPVELAKWSEFHQCIENLPDDIREMLDLLYYQGLTQEKAAQILGVSVSTIKRRWPDAKLKLFEILGENLPDEL